jgi:hypothetical protein
MDAWVNVPRIAGDTVWFHWNQSAPNPYQRENAFYFRYEGIDLSHYSPFLFHEIFLALQLRVFADYTQPVHIHFSSPVAAPSVAFWRTYHGADRVTIDPICEVDSYDPWRAAPRLVGQRQASIFFGGGKDSLAAANIFAEVYSVGDVLLTQYVAPLRSSPKLEKRLEARQDRLMLQPARERGFATQRVWTNYQANFHRDADRVRPHLELYTAGALPALLAWDVHVCAFSCERTLYRIHRRADGELDFHYAHSRPEILALQSRHYQTSLGIELAVTNINLLFTGLMDFRLLAERYPDAFLNAVGCTLADEDERYCYNCPKCMEYAVYSLGCGIWDDRFDYDRFFSTSTAIEQLVKYAESGVTLDATGNAPWIQAFSKPGQFLGYCHALSRFPLDTILGRLRPEAAAKLLIAHSLFGNRRYPSTELIQEAAIHLIDLDIAKAAANIGAEHFGIVEALPPPHLAGNEEVIWDFRIRMPVPAQLRMLR